MKIIIGGLLVSVLLSIPSTEHIDIQTDAYCVTYDLQFQNKDTAMGLTSNKENPQLMKINELIGEINDQNHYLKNLLKEKTKVLDKIQTLLDFRVYTKVPFDDVQMDSFKRFTGFYTHEAGALQNALKQIDADKDLMAAKKELLHKEANYNAIISELTSFSDNLGDAIRYLRGIIDIGNSTLQVL